jgi:hypothetical protein
MAHFERGCVAVLSAFFALTPLYGTSGQRDRLQTGYWSCYTAAFGNDPAYVSATWEDTAIADEVYAAFVKMLGEKYRFKGQAFCSRAVKGSTDLKSVAASREQLYQQWEKQGRKVVRTGWTSLAPATKKS